MALIIFDVDGTIKPTIGKIPKSTYSAIKKLKEVGHYVSIASGRGDDELSSILERLDIHSYVAYGGSKVVIDGETIFNQYFNEIIINQLCDYFEKKKIAYFMCHEKKSFSSYLPRYIKYFFMLGKPLLFLGIIDGSSSIASYIKNISKVKVLERNQMETTKVKKIIFFSRRLEKDRLFDLRIDHKVIFNLIEYEIKDYGIDILKKQLNQEKIIVFGDGYNDISMFQHADIAIAMGNAKEELKKHAHYITSDSNKDGIYEACEAFEYFR